jgi:glycosyltransferase involved in cell wall biosynthesis
VISFIIPAYNEEQHLGRTLDAINGAAGALDEPSEIIVVDDASTDATAAVAHTRGARVIAVNCRQIAAVRNAGAMQAKGNMLIFVDADTVVSIDVVRAAVRAMREGAVGGGAAVRFDGQLPFWGKVTAALFIPLYRLAGLAAGCFLFCTRDAFEAVGGFNKDLFAAEEVVMTRALRRQGRFVLLHESVTTSGRKLRAYSARELLGILARLAVAGPKALGRREGLELWYGDRRKDPHSHA